MEPARDERDQPLGHGRRVGVPGIAAMEPARDERDQITVDRPRVYQVEPPQWSPLVTSGTRPKNAT